MITVRAGNVGSGPESRPAVAAELVLPLVLGLAHAACDKIHESGYAIGIYTSDPREINIKSSIARLKMSVKKSWSV